MAWILISYLIGETYMATIKNFGIVGIGQSVQYGKGGGKVVYDTGNSLFKVTTDGTTLSHLDVATTPTADNHATSKAYVDSVATGLDVKDSVRAASTGDITVSAPGASIDGVALAQGDRVLLKDQVTQSQNGIYIFNTASTTLTRAADMNESGEFVGAFFFVEEGTQNSDQGFVCTTDGTVTVDATAITFSQFTGTGQISPGAGLSKAGNQIDVNVDDTFIKIDANDDLTIKGTATTGEVLQSDGNGGVSYGTVNLGSTNSVSGILPLANGGLGTEAATTSGKATARTNLGLGSMATQNSNSVNITGGTIDISGGTLTLADDQISGNKVSGGTIDGANLAGGAGNTLTGYDITVGAGKTLDVDGVLDVDAANGSAIDNVVIGATTSAAGTFTTMTSGNVDINGGAIDGTTIGANAPAAITGTTIDATIKVKTDVIESHTANAEITFNSPINAAAGINVAGVTSPNMNADTINEDTLNAGVTVDGVLLKDGNVTANVGTFTSTVVTSADIDGGTIDGTVIGGASSAAGTFTDLVSANVTLSGGTISGTDVNLTGQALTLDDDSISGDKVHGGVISNFASTGIDDNATGTMLTLSPATTAPTPASHTGTTTGWALGSGGADSILINGEAVDFTSQFDTSASVGSDGSWTGDSDIANIQAVLLDPIGTTLFYASGTNANDADNSIIHKRTLSDVADLTPAPTDSGQFTSSVLGKVTAMHIAGGKFFVGNGNNQFHNSAIKQFSLSGTNPNVNTVQGSFDYAAAIAAEGHGNANVATGIDFNADGTKMYLSIMFAEKVFEFDLAAPYTVAGATYDGVFKSIASNVDWVTNSLHFSNDGTKFFVVDQGARKVAQFNMAIPYDIANATHAGTVWQNLPVGTADSGLTFTSDFSRAIVHTNSSGGTTYSYAITNAPINVTTVVNTINSAGIDGVTATAIGGALKISDSNSDLVLAENGGTTLSSDFGMTAGTYNLIGPSDPTASFSHDVSIAGNLTVSGTLTSIQTTNTTITDNTITLNDGETGAGVTAGSAGIEIDRGTLDNATLLWNETIDAFELKVGANLADLFVDSLAMTGIKVDTIESLTPSGDINFSSAISGTDATFSGSVSTDTINEVTVGAGVTADGVILKDGAVIGGLTAEVGDTVDVSAATLTLANDQISGDSIEGGTIGSITISSLVASSADVNGGTIDGTTIGGTTSAAGTFSTLTSDSVNLNGGAIDGTNIGVNSSAIGTFTTMNTSNADINGGNIDGTTIGGSTSATGTFSTLNTSTANITGGAISGTSVTTSALDANGGTIDATVIGANSSAAGTFSTLTTDDAQIGGGNVTATNGTFTNLTSGNVNITGGTITGIDIDTSGSSVSFADDQISGDKVHGGTISDSSLIGTTGSTISGYDITVGAGKTLDVSAGTLTLANNQISGDKVHGGSISDFASTGIDDNATATKLTLTDTTATFGVAVNAGANAISGGAGTFSSLNVNGDAVVTGNLTVSGAVTTTLAETVEIEDNILLLNSDVTGGTAPSQDSGIEVNRGSQTNAKWYWDETNDEWTSKDALGNAANINVGAISSSSFTLTGTIARTDGGTGTDTSGFADNSLMIMSGTGTTVAELAKGSNSTVLKVDGTGALGYGKVDLTTDVSGTLPIANGGTGLATNGSDRQVLVADATGALVYEYMSTLRNSSGLATLNTANMASGTGEYLEVTNGTGRVTVTAKNAANSGIVDLYLQGQDGGDVFLVGDSGEALLQGEDDTDLTVAGGDTGAGDAGDLILKGGNGSTTFLSGSVILKGGIGGAADGNVEILGANDTPIAVFTETSTTAPDYFEFKNGTGGVELHTEGTSADVNLTLAPKGTGLVVAPAGYDMSSGGAKAFVTKDYVDNANNNVTDNLIRQSFTANGSSSFTVGTLKNVSGRTYYVSRIVMKITTAFVGADELVISDGVNTLVGALDADIAETGQFVVDLGYENVSAGGSTITANIQNSGAAASPTVGAVIVTVEYKAM